MSAKGYCCLPIVGNCVAGNTVVVKLVICSNLLLLVVCVLPMFLKFAIDLLEENKISFAPLQWLSIPIHVPFPALLIFIFILGPDHFSACVMFFSV